MIEKDMKFIVCFLLVTVAFIFIIVIFSRWGAHPSFNTGDCVYVVGKKQTYKGTYIDYQSFHRVKIGNNMWQYRSEDLISCSEFDSITGHKNEN